MGGSHTRSTSYSWVVVGLALIAMIGFAWPFESLGVLYPFVRIDLDLSRTQVGFISSGIMGGGIVTAYLGGGFADRLGVRRVIFSILMAMAGLVALLSTVNSFMMFLLVGVLIGTAQGPGYPSVSRAIMTWAPAKVRGLSMSVMLTGAPFAGFLAAALLPNLASWTGWRAALLTLSGFIFAIGIGFLVLYRDTPEGKRATRVLRFEAIHALIKNRRLMILTIWASIFAALNVILVSYLALYCVEVLELSAIIAGTYLAIAHISSVVSRVAWGAISDFLYTGRRQTILVLIGFTAAIGLIGTSLLTSESSQVFVSVLIFTLGITILSWHGVFTAAVGELGSNVSTGATIGAVETVLRTTSITVTPLFGLTVDATGSYLMAWLLCAIAAAGSTLILIIFGRDPAHS